MLPFLKLCNDRIAYKSMNVDIDGYQYISKDLIWYGDVNKYVFKA